MVRAEDNGAGPKEVGDGKEPGSSALETVRGLQVGQAPAFKTSILKHPTNPAPIFLTQ